MRELAVLLALGATPVAAQGVDESCMDTAMTQYDLNVCAGSIYRQADEELNQVYREALAVAQEVDLHATDGAETYGDGTAEEQLRAAQRAWLPFRDLSCDAFAKRLGGGSWLPMQHAFCRADVTQERTRQLQAYIAGGEG